jgi:hypothetical protein
MSSFSNMIRMDIKLLFSVQDFCHSNPGFDNFMKSIVSKFPHKDIVLVIYLISLFALVELGHKHFWLCIINLSTAFRKFKYFFCLSILLYTIYTYCGLVLCVILISHTILYYYCVVCRKLIAAKRPVEYNRALMPITDIAAESYGYVFYLLLLLLLSHNLYTTYTICTPIHPPTRLNKHGYIYIRNA